VSPPRYAGLASKLLARDPSPAPLPSPGERTQAISAIAAALAARSRRRRAQRWGAVVGAVAATFVLAFCGARLLSHPVVPLASAPAPAISGGHIVAHPVAGGSSLVVQGAEVPLDDGRLLSPGSRVVTPASGRATLSFSSGTGVLLREGTDLTVAADGASQVLRLDEGSIELHVAKLKANQRFLVDTVDSEVEVRGTRFTVAVVPPDSACGAGVRTRVAVTEGVVVVRHAGNEDRVPAGTQWPVGCPAAAPAPAVPPDRAPVALAPTAAAGGSTLAEQNDLFARAVSARRRGDVRDAVALLNRFSASYPSSPLAEGVLVERMRILRATARPRSAAVAADYLARYPNGFARSEAEAIVAEGP
jgi:ferric-dicitrate binding protein FerR (iron transport regulator)